MIKTTDKETYTIIPRRATIQANELLSKENIDYKFIEVEETPDGVPCECIFKGRKYKFEEARAIIAKIDPESFIKELDAYMKR